MKLKLQFVVFFLILIQFEKVISDLNKIEPELLSLLETGETANVIVYFIKGVNEAIQKVNALRIEDRSQRNQQFVKVLQENSQESQGAVLSTLSTRRNLDDSVGFKDFKTYWVGNKVFIRDATAETVYAVAEDPGVLKIEKEGFATIPGIDEVSDDPSTKGELDKFKIGLWGINRTQIHEAWDELGGNSGEGILVGIFDTGVQATHEALKDNFIGTEYGWYDPAENEPEPKDHQGHGTHVTGIIAGSKGIGVAPGAKWMTCKPCTNTKCPFEAMLDCMQWFACPTLPDGSNPDCSKIPHVISNSWGPRRGNDSFNEEIQTWRALGIIPVFSVGNAGPDCNTTIAPGELPFVIGVGATTIDDTLYERSSVGYSSFGGIKPDLVAPGKDIVSSAIDLYSNIPPNENYELRSGTSMACPHVAGIVALLKVRNKDLTFEEAYELLTQNTDQMLTVKKDDGEDGQSSWPIEREYCNETDAEVYPNNFFGFGLVNALKAVKSQTIALSK